MNRFFLRMAEACQLPYVMKEVRKSASTRNAAVRQYLILIRIALINQQSTPKTVSLSQHIPFLWQKYKIKNKLMNHMRTRGKEH
jgi:hypothetical protein